MAKMDTKEYRKITELRLWDKNPRNIREKDFARLKKQIAELGQYKPLLITKDGEVIGGNMRLRAFQDMGIKDVWVSVVDPKTEEEKMRYALSDNDRAGYYDDDMLSSLQGEYPDFEWGDYAVDLDYPKTLDEMFPQEVEEDEVPEVTGEAVSKLGEVYQLGRHRLMCGDSTKIEDVEKLMNGQKADMVFTDPPYGIGKEIENDNLNNQRLHEFNHDWIVNALMVLKENGYCFIWGQFQVLSRIWCEVLLPLKTCAFRNFIVWKKHAIQGINSSEFRQFPENYEACLLFIHGNPFENGAWSTSPNAEFYPEMFEPIRAYLDAEREAMGWGIPTVKKLVGHSDLSGDHWFNRSQWSMPTREVYETIQREAKGKAFRKQYDELRKQYDELRKQYDELRGYFDNTNGYTDLWDIVKTETNELHPTVKPLEVCTRGIISTSENGNAVLDLFGGSGSSLIACEQLNRVCYMMEIDPKYCDVIRKRYAKFIGKEEEWEMITTNL